VAILNFDDFEVLTFDCYGTLIDWETGLWEALRPILAAHGIDIVAERALELYGELEAEVERGEYHEYRVVLQMVLERFGSRVGFRPNQNELQQFSQSVHCWPVFLDSPHALRALKKKFKLAIISNIDDDLFASSANRLEVEFDWVITAQQVGSYKPSLQNFLVAIEQIGLPKNQILHVAQSVFHDIVPAKTLGLSTVWINRRHDKRGPGATPQADGRPDFEFPDLQSFAAATGLM
jgi:2-haloacid dehalogenase